MGVGFRHLNPTYGEGRSVKLKLTYGEGRSRLKYDRARPSRQGNIPFVGWIEPCKTQTCGRLIARSHCIDH